MFALGCVARTVTARADRRRAARRSTRPPRCAGWRTRASRTRARAASRCTRPSAGTCARSCACATRRWSASCAPKVADSLHAQRRPGADDRPRRPRRGPRGARRLQLGRRVRPPRRAPRSRATRRSRPDAATRGASSRTSPSTCWSRATRPARRPATRSPTRPRTRPSSRYGDPRLGPWLRHAPANAIVWRDSVNLTRDPRSRVQALLNMSAILRLRAAQPALRVPADRPASRAARAFSAAVGARHVPALDVDGLRVPHPRLRAGRAARRAARPRAPRARRSRARRSIPRPSATRCATCTTRRRPRAGPARAAARGRGPRVRRHARRATAAAGAAARLLRPGVEPRGRGAGAASLPRRVLPPPALGVRARGRVGSGNTPTMADRELGAGAWSYFGDPRAISHDGHTFTGWISTVGQRVGRALHRAAGSSPSS